MQLTLRGTTYEDSEVERYILLRKLEWDAFPVYTTRAFAPLALFWIPWWQLILILTFASIVWCLIRNHIASPDLADVAVKLNNIFVSLLANFIVAAIFFWQGRILEGLIALFWNLISTALSLTYPPSRKSALAEKLWSKVQT